jgi:hypothetical protein
MMQMFIARKTSNLRPRPAAHRRGLSLAETALATIIVGTAVLGIIRLIGDVSIQSSYAQKTTTALMLADNMREVMNGLPFNDPATGTHLGPNVSGSAVSQYNDCEDFSGYVASPPIDANCQPISSMSNWQQSVSVTHVNPSNYTLTDGVANDAACNMDRIKVVVSYEAPGTNNWVPIVTVEWLKTKL